MWAVESVVGLVAAWAVESEDEWEGESGVA